MCPNQNKLRQIENLQIPIFFAVNTVCHELGSRKKATKENDLPTTLDAFNNKKTIQEIEAAIVPSGEIIKNFDGDMIEGIINHFEPLKGPNLEYRIIEVS